MAYYNTNQHTVFGAMLIVAIVVVCFSLINLVNTTITNFLSRKQEIGMLQAIGLSKKQLIKMLRYEGLLYSLFATLVTLFLGTGLGFICAGGQISKSVLLLFVPVAGNIAIFGDSSDRSDDIDFLYHRQLKKHSLVEQIRVTE